MILILTEEDDPHADAVIAALRRRGAAFVRFNPRDFPSRATLTMAYTAAGAARSVLEVGGEAIDLERVTAAWYRRPDLPEADEAITDPLVRQLVAEESWVFANDLWQSLACRWVPAPRSVLRRAELKAAQLRLAAALGFELPPTLFTNSPAEFLEFYRAHNGELISKLADGRSFFETIGKTYVRYTEVVSKRDVGYARQVRYGPVLFQAYVPKRMELRVTVVGEAVFAAEIHSQETRHTRTDWRRYDHHGTRYRPHALPQVLARGCRELVRELGLCYGAIDLILTPDDRYVFLEINPNGQYLWIEEATGLPISAAVADLLAAGGPAGNEGTR